METIYYEETSGIVLITISVQNMIVWVICIEIEWKYHKMLVYDDFWMTTNLKKCSELCFN